MRLKCTSFGGEITQTIFYLYESKVVSEEDVKVKRRDGYIETQHFRRKRLEGSKKYF